MKKSVDNVVVKEERNRYVVTCLLSPTFRCWICFVLSSDPAREYFEILHS